VISEHQFHERNPFLGLRSIRVSMKYPETFRTQVRAILRASAFGKVKLMLPMITALEELRWAKRVIEETKEDLRLGKQDFDAKIEVGIMIEVPAAALEAHNLAKEAAFFSIGTNDLTQYTLAVDRGNEWVANLYSPANPAVITLIRKTIEAAAHAKIPVSMCGEMAGDPLFTILLVGLGLTELSVAPASIPEVKTIIRHVKYETCRDVAAKTAELEDTSAIVEYLRDKLAICLPGGEKFGQG
jgi:phosphoenolpyruvate-protein phosphotransferase (PTS system enzyme I)